MNSCVFTGSFDPFTRGHLDIVKRVGKVFDRVYVAVLKNDLKETMFNMEQREAIVRAAIADLENAEVFCHEGLAVDAARQHGARAIIRGIRNLSDLDYEREMAFANGELDERIETLFVLSHCPQVSSTAVRELIKLGGRLDSVLTKKQIQIINNFNIRGD